MKSNNQHNVKHSAIMGASMNIRRGVGASPKKAPHKDKKAPQMEKKVRPPLVEGPHKENMHSYIHTCVIFNKCIQTLKRPTQRKTVAKRPTQRKKQ